MRLSHPAGTSAPTILVRQGSLAIAASGLPQGEFQTVVKFDLSAAKSSFDAQFGVDAWNIQSLTLELTSSPHGNPIFNTIAAGKFNVSLMQNNSWVEGTGTGGIPTTDGISFSTLQSTLYIGPSDQSLVPSDGFNFPGGSSGVNSYSLTLSPGLISDLLAGDDASLRLFAADSKVSYLFSSLNSGPTTVPELIITAIPEPGSIALFKAWFDNFSGWRFK